MKRFLFSIITVLLVIPTIAQNTLTIHQKDGQQFSYGFGEKPVVSFTDNNLIIKSSNVEVNYELANLSKFTFDEKDTGVDEIKYKTDNASIKLDEYTVKISHSKPDITVSVIGSDGKTIKTYKTDTEGYVSFSINDFPDGLYIISTESLTVKIIRK